MSSVHDPDAGLSAPGDVQPPILRTASERAAHIRKLEAEMKAAAADLDFERAASIRDDLKLIRARDLGLGADPSANEQG